MANLLFLLFVFPVVEAKNVRPAVPDYLLKYAAKEKCVPTKEDPKEGPFFSEWSEGPGRPKNAILWCDPENTDGNYSILVLLQDKNSAFGKCKNKIESLSPPLRLSTYFFSKPHPKKPEYMMSGYMSVHEKRPPHGTIEPPAEIRNFSNDGLGETWVCYNGSWYFKPAGLELGPGT